ncbi:MAG: hypothetical protein COB02_01245 [Candidatus Cloacimonadota bacterium]|nr:MAG: hypothetical protein COB02_01245 [Candidatus Cloacimonadota bacterium]
MQNYDILFSRELFIMQSKKIISYLVVFSFFIYPISVHSGGFKSFFKKYIKTAAIAAVVRKAAPALNNFINGLLLNKGLPNKSQTKVVPLFSFGEKLAVGAVQVSGSVIQLRKVRACVQIDGVFSSGKFRVKAYVPTTSSTKFKRVHGVGVTALIDYHVR